MNVGQWFESNRGLLTAGAIASLVAGIPAGLLARVAMAIIADAGGSSMMAVVGQLTLGGTLRIVIVPMIFGIPFAIVVLWLGQRLWRQSNVVVRAGAYALAGLAIPGLLFFTDAEFKISGANQDVGPLAFVPTFLVFGLLVGLIGDWLLARRARTATD